MISNEQNAAYDCGCAMPEPGAGGPDSTAATDRACPVCNGWGKVEKLGLRGFKLALCRFCEGSGRV